MTEVDEQPAQSGHVTMKLPGVEPATLDRRSGA